MIVMAHRTSQSNVNSMLKEGASGGKAGTSRAVVLLSSMMLGGVVLLILLSSTGSESFKELVSSTTLMNRRLSLRMLMRAFKVLLGSLAEGAG